IVTPPIFTLFLHDALPIFTGLYLFASTALAVFLTTMARSIPQFGLLAIPVVMPMLLLSGGSTPLDSMPEWLQMVMQFSPTTHFRSEEHTSDSSHVSISYAV